MDTIFAQASGIQKSGVSVFRISGRRALEVLKRLSSSAKLQPRRLYYKKLIDYRNGYLIDNALVSFFEKPNSFTGEDVVELHIHGSIAVSKLLSDCLASMQIRLAEPGEFSKRAFLNNKMDLTQAEGLADLINAETLVQHRQAISHASGAAFKQFDLWRGVMLKMLSLLEAYIDFPDEDIPEEVIENVDKMHLELLEEIKTHTLNDTSERIRSGIKMVIFGPTNAGKSTLMNYLTKRDVSIISSIPGTTRDVIESYVDIGGYPITLLDTAGIRDTDNEIENEGIKKAISRIKDADIKVLLLDVASINNLEKLDKKLLELIENETVIAINKIDTLNLLEQNIIKNINGSDIKGIKPMLISLYDEKGLDKLLEVIKSKAEALAIPSPLIARDRHRQLLLSCVSALEEFSLSKELVLAAEDIRIASRHLGQIVGKIDVDEILGEIFASFCIGK